MRLVLHIKRRLLTCGWALLLWPLAAGAQTAPVAEYALKAALLFKLPQFVYLPASPRGAEVDICLLGRNPFGAAPDTLSRYPQDGRTLRWRPLGQVGDAQDCDLVFIARSEAAGLDALLRRLAKTPVLTVSDIEGFAAQGGMVELSLAEDGQTVRLQVNRKAGQKQGIEFNAQLLRLAKVVEP